MSREWLLDYLLLGSISFIFSSTHSFIPSIIIGNLLDTQELGPEWARAWKTDDAELMLNIC